MSRPSVSTDNGFLDAATESGILDGVTGSLAGATLGRGAWHLLDGAHLRPFASEGQVGFGRQPAIERHDGPDTARSFLQASSGAAFPAPAPNYAAYSSDPLRAIDWGSKIVPTTIDVYFAPAGTFVDLGTSSGWLLSEKNQVMLALRQIEAVTNLHFRETKTQAGAEFRLATTTFDDGTIGFMIPPGEDYAGLAAFDTGFLEATDADSGNSLLERGGYMFAILLEELGHGLGLAHPHDDGGTSTILSGVRAPVGSFGIGNLNQGVNTVMGYNEGWPAGPNGTEYQTGRVGRITTWINDFGYEAGPMALDIAVLQAKYGANMTQATGANTYRLPDANRLGTSFQSIWDAGGRDTLRYDGARDATLDLRAATLKGAEGGGGWVSWATGIRGGYTIANGVVIENALGGSGNDRIIGNSAANLLRGGAGNDSLVGNSGNDTLMGDRGADRMWGGRGNDTYTIDSSGDAIVERQGEGIDRVLSTMNYVLPDDVENLVLTGRAVVGKGNALDNILTGNALANVLKGGNGNDTLNGGLGADRMEGGSGNDSYFVDRAGDRPVEGARRGNDLVTSTVNYTLPGNIENLTLAGSAANGKGNALANLVRGTAGNNVLSGAAGNDTLIGGAGRDTLVGGPGADRMRGDAGNDTYYTDHRSDRVWEAADQGRDRVISSVSYTLTPNVETLTLAAGYAALNGKGNALDNLIRGNDGDNVLMGADGNDTLIAGDGNNRLLGGNGNDRLYASNGNDTLEGGAGNDAYYLLNHNSYLVIEAADAGIDRIVTVNEVFTLPDNVENLTMSGYGTGTGNELDNVMSGGGSLFGLAGNDTLSGATWLYGGDGNDTLIAGSQSSFLDGGAGDDLLVGGAGDDELAGGEGANRIEGGAGDDSYYVDDARDVLVEAANAGTDRVYASVDVVLGANIENLVIQGSGRRRRHRQRPRQPSRGSTGANVLRGEAGDDSLQGNDGNDRLIGGLGADTLIGGVGDDTFVFETLADSPAGSGRDVIDGLRLPGGHRPDRSLGHRRRCETWRATRPSPSSAPPVSRTPPASCAFLSAVPRSLPGT